VNRAAYFRLEIPADHPVNETTLARARHWYNAQLHQQSVRVDRYFVCLMALQWAFAILLAVTLAPRRWEGLESAVHPHVWSALFLGGWLSLPPILLAWTSPGTVVTRQAMATAQVLWSALLIHLTEGRIETHFHIFGSLAFLAMYRDVRVLATATAVVLIDHALRGWLAPQSVYGDYAFAFWRTLEHGGWVLFEDVVLLYACRDACRDLWQRALQHARLESNRDVIALEVSRQTEEIRLREAEAHRLLEAAESANRTKSQFLANMSHEIRTPMTSILGYTELLMEEDLKSLDHEMWTDALATIQRNGNHLLGLINDILDISKIEAGQMTFEHRACCLTDVLADVAKLLQVRLTEKSMQLSLHFQPDVPVQVLADPTRLRQILINIVGNAVKFSEQGPIEIDIQRSTSATNLLWIDITDLGIGMTNEQQAGLFRPFCQGDDSMTRRFGGTGLGLVISQRLAQMLGGDLQVLRTSPGAGTTMRLTLEVDAIDTQNQPAQSDDLPSLASLEFSEAYDELAHLVA